MVCSSITAAFLALTLNKVLMLLQDSHSYRPGVSQTFEVSKLPTHSFGSLVNPATRECGTAAAHPLQRRPDHEVEIGMNIGKLRLYILQVEFDGFMERKYNF